MLVSTFIHTKGSEVSLAGKGGQAPSLRNLFLHNKNNIFTSSTGSLGEVESKERMVIIRRMLSLIPFLGFLSLWVLLLINLSLKQNTGHVSRKDKEGTQGIREEYKWLRINHI